MLGRKTAVQGSCVSLAVIALQLLLLAQPVGARTGATQPCVAPVVIDYFFEEGCPACERLAARTLPALAAQHGGRYRLIEHDLGVESNYLRFCAVQLRLGGDDNATVYMVVDDRVMLAGEKAVAERLIPTVGAALADPVRRVAASMPSPSPQDRAPLLEMLSRFTWGGVLTAGLVDSLNPCAIATLVFFMSLLVAGGARAPRLLTAGLAFAAGAYLAYFALGFGLLRAWRAFDGILWLRAGLNVAMAGGLLVLAAFSFRDAWRYARRGRVEDVTLQLPAATKRRIHALLRAGLRAPLLALGAAVAGVAVTLLESLCTGQVYLPTLALIARGGPSSGLALRYLAAYNLMFVLPLLAVLGLTLGGLRLTRLMSWSRRNVVTAKSLTGLLCLAIASLLLALS
ncbi:MAG: hypothetical protein PHR35_15260 [Kiritimatiellae bacterium]|nr:hypothetical protein [Kiritimatiellia bacterium]